MSMSITQILLVIIAAVLFLAISISWWVLNGNPQAMKMIEDIIPSLTQAEKLSLEQGFKAIHVKLRPFKEGIVTDDPLILYEFHPTNEGALGRKHLESECKGGHMFFNIKKWHQDECTMFVSKEGNDNFEPRIYYLTAGTVIEYGSENIFKSMIISSSGCDTPTGACGYKTPTDYSLCIDSGSCNFYCLNEDNDVVNQQFTASTTDNCVYDEEGCPYINGKRDCCAFAKVASNQHVYEPAYNILCGNEQGSPETRWYACTNEQYATIEANGAQFTCGNDGEWKVKSGSGIQIINPQLKYESGLLVVDKTNLEFVVINNQNEEIKDVKVSAKVADPESGVDCLGNTQYANSVEKTTASIAKNGGIFKYSHDNFCYKAKTFDVDVVSFRKSNPYDNRKSFYIECKNANLDNGYWQTCNLAMPGEYKGISQGITSTLDITCNSKNYNIQLTGPGTTYPYGDKYINTIIKENGATISNDQIYLSRTVAANNVKITIWEFDDSNAPSWKAKIWARCA